MPEPGRLSARSPWSSWSQNVTRVGQSRGSQCHESGAAGKKLLMWRQRFSTNLCVITGKHVQNRHFHMGKHAEEVRHV